MVVPTRDTIVIVGAGPGVGAAVAHRFASERFSVGLIARNRDRLAELAMDLRNSYSTTVAIATADATNPSQLESAVEAVTVELGAASAMCFSPIPDVTLIKPVTETRADEFMESLQLNIAGAVTAVRCVLPAMQAVDRGSLLFTTGSAALRPDPARAASAITTTAASVYISLLRQALSTTGIRVGHTVIVGPIGGDENGHDPKDIANDLWHHHVGTATDFPTVLRLT